jgi:excisionase family DNA binding protein
MRMLTWDAFSQRLPDQFEIQNAEQMRQILAAQLKPDDSIDLQLALDSKPPAQLTLAPALAASLMELLRLIASGKGFRMIPLDAELTTQQAADLLNVSRPHLVKLLEENHIAFIKTGRHRRVRATDLFEFKKKRDSKRAAALARLAQMDMESDLL